MWLNWQSICHWGLHTGKDCPSIPDCWNCTRWITHVNVVELTEHLPFRFTHVNWWFTHVNQQFTHRQRLSVHVLTCPYMCKPQWPMLCQFNHIYTCNLPCMIPMIWNVRTVFVCKLPVYMYKPLVYTCKPKWQMLCQFNHIYTCNLPCMISMIWNVRTVFACV